MANTVLDLTTPPLPATPPPSPFQAAAKSLREQPSAGLEGGRTALQITEPNAQQLSKAPLKASGQKVVPVFVSDENAI